MASEVVVNVSKCIKCFIICTALMRPYWLVGSNSVHSQKKGSCDLQNLGRRRRGCLEGVSQLLHLWGGGVGVDRQCCCSISHWHCPGSVMCETGWSCKFPFFFLTSPAEMDGRGLEWMIWLRGGVMVIKWTIWVCVTVMLGRAPQTGEASNSAWSSRRSIESVSVCGPRLGIASYRRVAVCSAAHGG